ncbi:MAG: D-alanyl-D-alanine carboxypeptidase [Pseudomonadales bacterium]|nr:D-alanyl-D-alanine carboxypeptidase [Pseudomonadales bacterium]
MRQLLQGVAVLGMLFSVAHAEIIVPAPPALDDKAYLVMDFESGQVLAAKNADQRLGPASLTKLMTSYIVERALLEGRLHEDDAVSISDKAWRHGSNQESTMFLPVNGQARVIDLLRGIIVVSANDACTAVAEHIAGTESAFADIMNSTAQQLGLVNTHYMNASGLPDPQHYSSARDLAILARTIIRDNAHYYPIYSEREFAWGGHTQGNRNALLYTDPTVDGLKTGHTDESGYSLVASAKRHGMRLIVVVLGTDSKQARADQPRALLNWGYSFYETVVPYRSGTPLTHVHVWFAQQDTVAAGLGSDLALTIPKGSQSGLRASIILNPDLHAPIAQGQVLGKVVTTLNGKPYAEQPLIALQPDEQAGFFKRLWQHIVRFFTRIG